MPEISRFFGIVIAMFYNDHPPPHFHVPYGRQRAIIDLGTLAVLEGSPSPRVLGLVVEWAVQHQDELRAIGTVRATMRYCFRSSLWTRL